MLPPDRDPGAANNALASIWNGSTPDEHIWGGADPEDLPVVEDCSTVIGVGAEIEGNTRMWPCSDLGFSSDLSAYNHGNAENASESDESSAESEPLEWEGNVIVDLEISDDDDRSSSSSGSSDSDDLSDWAISDVFSDEALSQNSLSDSGWSSDECSKSPPAVDRVDHEATVLPGLSSSYLPPFVRAVEDPVSRQLMYRCTWGNVCEYTSGNLSYLRRHARCHTDERPYACTHPGCNYAARQQGHLNRHKLTHLVDAKPLACLHPGCDYTTTVRARGV
jgi:hypothetical protein